MDLAHQAISRDSLVNIVCLTFPIWWLPMNGQWEHPKDEHLAALMKRAQQALARAGLSARDVLDELPAAREEVVTETYSAEFLREMDQLRQQLSGNSAQ